MNFVEVLSIAAAILLMLMIGLGTYENITGQLIAIEECNAIQTCEKYDCLLDKTSYGVHRENNLLLQKQNCLMEEARK